MDIATKYDPTQVEDKWYSVWLEQKFFHSTPDNRDPYTVVIPPPNVTGVLHMGHMLNNTIQDVLVRKARMEGKNACWLPGTDHASIATEAKVVSKLREEGIDKNSLTRDEFLRHAWAWKEKHGGIILEQLKKLGASCDWERTAFTMDDRMTEAVIEVFVDLYNKGCIYRGVRMINWDPKALTALSDEEVMYREVQSALYYINYPIAGEPGKFVVIATTRPETILGDTAVCVNPADERFRELKDKKVLVPLINREIPVIEDDYVDQEFGTGALKVTPAHDLNDYNLGIKYNLETIDIFNDNGTLNEKAQLYIGEDRFVVRKKIVQALEAQGYLEKKEEYTNKVGFSERTDEVIEPKLSLQWFCDMSKMAVPALENVMNERIRFYPAKFKNTYRHWMENVKDWCISRQLWWGQRIPAYYYGNGATDFVVATTPEEALKLAVEKTGLDTLTVDRLRQDEDVLDTWFSSWLWPISTFDGILEPENDDIRYYYPTNDLVTAPEILFFWVARMIMAGYEFRGDMPFKNVYLTGIVRDKQRRKMSKSLGNSPDPLDLIAKYGADGVRVGMLLSSPAGNDLLFDEALCEQGRNFSNKIWNAFRLLNSWEVDEQLPQPESSKTAALWFSSQLNASLVELNDHYQKYRLSDALMGVYKLIWDSYCAWYLEIIKPEYQKPVDMETRNQAICFLETLLKIVHPFMPFLSEEIYHLIGHRETKDCIVVATYPTPGPVDALVLNEFSVGEQVVMAIRNLRKERDIPVRDLLEMTYIDPEQIVSKRFTDVIAKLCGLSVMQPGLEKPEQSLTFMVKAAEFFIAYHQEVDVEKEIEKLTQELGYTRGFLASVLKKLENERFVQGAPAQVVENEKKKQDDALAKIQVLEEKLVQIKKSIVD